MYFFDMGTSLLSFRVLETEAKVICSEGLRGLRAWLGPRYLWGSGSEGDGLFVQQSMTSPLDPEALSCHFLMPLALTGHVRV
jgi:hypothetical protein